MPGNRALSTQNHWHGWVAEELKLTQNPGMVIHARGALGEEPGLPSWVAQSKESSLREGSSQTRDPACQDLPWCAQPSEGTMEGQSTRRNHGPALAMACSPTGKDMDKGDIKSTPCSK